jgi:hypothetical protein
MKKVITLLAALAASWASYAQTDLDTTFDDATVDDNRPLLEIADEWYKPLDKTKMPTTTFYNRILAPMAYPIYSYDTTSF